MGIGVEKKGIALNKEKNMIKRKRLDARAFRDWHESLAKKHKSPICGETSRGSWSDTMLLDGSDSLETSCLKESCDISNVRHIHRKRKRMDLGVKSVPGNGEVTNKKYGVSVEGSQQESSSANAELREKLLCDGGDPGDKEVHSSNHENCGSDRTNKGEMEGESNCHVPRSEGFSDCKPSSPRFSEYWVPVGFSHLQLEKYCEILVKNSALLCSSKKGNMDVLHDVLAAIRKCCDHPYLVDPSLVTFVNEGRPAVDSLSIGIEVSGKLLLLDKFLQEVREKQLRVVIVFQSNNSNSLRHILDDFVCRRFGEGSYVHVYREFDNAKKRAALDLFNDKCNGRFAVLIEKSSCQASIRLSSVDFVILFNSDWSLVNDMKALRKMSIQAQLDHVKVFRLYSANSVEEKVLMLAKGGVVLESSISSFSYNISHMLLLWGTSHLFTKLNDFHSLSDNLTSSAEQKLLHDVLYELSGLLSCQEGENLSCSCISKVPEASDISNVSLYGLQDASCRNDDTPHFAVWIRLLEGTSPPWKLLPGSSLTVKRKSQCGKKDPMIMSKSMVHCRGEYVSLEPRARKGRTTSSRRKSSNLAGDAKLAGNGVDLFSCREFNSSCHIEEACNRRVKEIVLKQEDICEFYRTLSEERAKLDEEHHLQLALIGQRYGETAIKQQELKKLDDIYKGKIEKFNGEMDMKRKELEDAQRASRKKEKQLKDRLLAFSTKDLEGPISSPSNSPLLNSELKLQTFELVERHLHSRRPVSNSVCLSESHGCKGIEQDMVDGSFDCDSELPPNQLVEEAEIVSVESNHENAAASAASAKASNSKAHSCPVLGTEKIVSWSTSIGGKPNQDVQHISNTDIQGNGSTKMGPSEDTSSGVIVHLKPMGSLSQSLESDGENCVMVSSGKASETNIKPLHGVSNLCIWDEHQLCTLTGEKNMEPSSNVLHKELLDGGNNTPAAVGTSNGETANGGVGLETTTVGRQTRIEHVTDTPAAGLDSSSSILVQPETWKSGNSSQWEQATAAKEQPWSEAQQCPLPGQKCSEPSPSMTNGEVHHGRNEMEPHIGERNGETEGRSSIGLGTVPEVSRRESIENLGESPSSILTSPSCVSMQPQACTTTGNSSSFGQSMNSTVLPSQEVRQNDSPLAVPSCQTITPLQLSVGCDTRSASILTGAPILPPANSYYQETSSLRCDVSPPTGCDPLQNELVKMRKEEAVAIKVHIDQVKLFKSACEKEMEEIQKKYELLVREAENTLVQKKEDLGSYCQKVCANKILAETMILFKEQVNLRRTQEFPLTAGQPLFSMQHQTPDPRFLPRPELAASPVQVVHQLSELVPTDSLNTAGCPLARYHTHGPAPRLLCNPISSLAISHNSLSFYGVQNQQALVPPYGSCPRSYPIDHSQGPVIQHEGCQDNPIVL